MRTCMFVCAHICRCTRSRVVDVRSRSPGLPVTRLPRPAQTPFSARLAGGGWGQGWATHLDSPVSCLHTDSYFASRNVLQCFCAVLSVGVAAVFAFAGAAGFPFNFVAMRRCLVSVCVGFACVGTGPPSPSRAFSRK
jgi:hypothetical protein